MYLRNLSFALARITVSGLAIQAALLAVPGQASAGPVTALVPAYFYPGPDWARLDQAAGVIPLEAIMNPASGPGTTVNSDYVAAVSQLQAAGGKVLGYVPTGSGGRSLSAVESDINFYVSNYHVNGIFLDQMGVSGTHAYYATLYQYIKSLSPNLRVVGNPGIVFSPVDQFVDVADTLVTFEGPLTNPDPNGASFQNYPNAGPYTGVPPWYLGQPSSKIANIVYDVPTAADMTAALNKAAQYNAGEVYFTDDTLPNPYDTLPSYWDQEVAAIQSLNSVPGPSALVMMVSGGLVGFVGLLRRRAKASTGPRPRISAPSVSPP